MLIATASNTALPGATTALNQLSSGLIQVQGAVAQGAAGASRLNDGAARLNSGAGQLASGLQAGVAGSSQLEFVEYFLHYLLTLQVSYLLHQLLEYYQLHFVSLK